MDLYSHQSTKNIKSTSRDANHTNFNKSKICYIELFKSITLTKYYIGYYLQIFRTLFIKMFKTVSVTTKML